MTDTDPPTLPAEHFAAMADLDASITRTQEMARRRPSIGDDGDVVLRCEIDDHGAYHLPIGTEPYHLVALVAHGYARYMRGELETGPLRTGFRLTAAGVELYYRWAEIRGHTVAAARPYGPLTPPSPGERADAVRGLPLRTDHAVPLFWPYQRPHA